MRLFNKCVLFLSLIFMASVTLNASVTITSDETDHVRFEGLTQVDYVTTVSDSNDNYFTMVQSGDLVYIAKTDENGIVTAFGDDSSGLKEVTFGKTSSEAIVRVQNFKSLVAQDVRLAVDGSDNLVLAFMITKSSNSKTSLFFSRIDGTTGDLDESSSFVGTNRNATKSIQAEGGTFSLEDMQVNSSGQTIILAYKDGVPFVYAISTENQLDTNFGPSGDGKMQSTYYVSNAVQGMSLDTDSRNHTFIAGQTDANEFFCVKLNSGGVVASGFGSRGLYLSSDLSTKLNGTTKTFISANYENDEIQLSSFAPTTKEIVMQKLSISGNFDSTFGISGTSAIGNESITGLSGYSRDAAGNSFLSGVYGDDDQSFMVKLYSNGNLDDLFGVRGYSLQDATSGSTIGSLTSVNIDSAYFGLLAFVETDSEDAISVRVDRSLTTVTSTLTVTSDAIDQVKIVNSESVEIESLDIVSDSLGNDFTLVRLGSDKLCIVKTNKDGLVAGFGNAGVKEINFGAIDSGKQIETASFSYLVTDQDSMLAVDNDNNLILAFMVRYSIAYDNFYCSRLNGTTGSINRTGEFDWSGALGAILVNFRSDPYTLQDVKVNSAGQIVMLTNYNEKALVHAIDTDNTVVGGGTLVKTDGYVDNVVLGSSLGLDANDNIYVAGQTDDYKFFCFKSASDGTVDTAFGGSGAYLSDDLSAKFDATTSTFISVDSVNSVIKIAALGTVPATNEIVVQQLDFDGAINDSDFVSGGTATIANSSLTRLGGMLSDGSGHLFFSGVYGTANSFLAKIYSSGSLDTNFGVGGYLLESPTGESTIEPSTSVSIDTAGYSLLAFAEVDGTDYVLRVDRTLSADPSIATVADAAVSDPTNANQSTSANSSSPATDVSGAHISLTGEDQTYLSLKNTDTNTFRISRFTPDGDVDTTFGTSSSDVSTILVSATVSTGRQTVNVENFNGFAADSTSHVKYSSDTNKIYIAFHAQRSSGDAYGIYLTCLDGTAGTVDTSFGGHSNGGIIELATSDSTDFALWDLVIDSEDRVIVGTTTSTGIKLFRYSSSGVADSNFGNSDYKTLSGSTIDNGNSGLTLSVDSDDNIYCMLHGDGNTTYNLVCARFKESNGRTDASFGATQSYISAETDLGDLSSSTVFNSVYQYQDSSGATVENILLVAKRTSAEVVIIQQLTIDGVLDTTFGDSGTQEVTIDGLATLTAVARNSSGQVFLGGTMTVDEVVVGFVARLTSDGILDTTFGEDSGDVKTGIINIAATTGWTLDAGIWFDLDSGGIVNAVGVEKNVADGSMYRLVHYSLLGSIEYYEQDLRGVVGGTDFVAYILAFVIGDNPSLQAYVGLSGVIADLEVAWADAGIDDAVIAIALPLVKSGIVSAFSATISHAVDNDAVAFLGIPYRDGSLLYSVNTALNVDSLSDDDRKDLAAGIITALGTITDNINAAVGRVSGVGVLTEISAS